MGMNPYYFNILSQVMKLTPSRPIKMVSLGYPDILVPESTLREFLSDEAMESLTYRPDSKQIAKWHGLLSDLDRVPEAIDLFRHMGVELSIIDFQEVRGDEIIVDLNFPISDDLRGKYDIVYDGGTMEHCFNISQAVANILGMAKVGGHVIHGNPLTMINHGFYNLSPTFYHDFYIQNGHKLASHVVATRNQGLETEAIKMHPTQKNPGMPIDAGVGVVIKKCNDEPTKFPVQSKYLAAPKLK